MCNSRLAAGVEAIAIPSFTCELQHDGNIDVALDFRRPMAETEWLRIGIWQFKAVLKRCTFTDAVGAGAVIPRSVCGWAIVR